MRGFKLSSLTYKRIMHLLHEEMNNGLSKKTNHVADIKMFPTFVRSLPDGTGNIYSLLLWDWWPSWPWSYGSWIYNYLCNQCLSPLVFWVWISIRARCTTLCDKVCQWLVTDRWFSPGSLVSSTNKTDRHDITEILLKVALSTSKQTNK